MTGFGALCQEFNILLYFLVHWLPFLFFLHVNISPIKVLESIWSMAFRDLGSFCPSWKLCGAFSFGFHFPLSVAGAFFFSFLLQEKAASTLNGLKKLTHAMKTRFKVHYRQYVLHQYSNTVLPSTVSPIESVLKLYCNSSFWNFELLVFSRCTATEAVIYDDSVTSALPTTISINLTTITHIWSV